MTQSEVIKEGMDSLIRAGYYKDKENLQDEAFRTLLEVKPELRTEVAIELYKSKKVSLSRAAEIAGVSLEGMKTILKSRGIKIEVEAPSKSELEEETGEILEEKYLELSS